ncbi:MAG TPA: hypothetical protein VIT68_01990, partial [Candidatus Gracilibacteria bacterium]
VSTGFMSLGQKLFPLLKDFTKAHPDNLGGLFAHMVESGQNKDFEILCHESKGDWFDIGSFETYLQAHTHLQKQTLLEGQNIKQSENTFSGKVSIADNCQVHNCVIIDSIIYPGVVLENCRISRCIIDEKTRLSGVDLNHKIIRRNTELKSGLDPQV